MAPLKGLKTQLYVSECCYNSLSAEMINIFRIHYGNFTGVFVNIQIATLF